MKRFVFPLGTALAVFLLAVLARPGSLGTGLRKAVEEYTAALESGRTAEALEMMTAETAEGLSEEFLLRLSGIEAPERFVFDGTDTMGIRMAGETESLGTRIIWFSTQNGIAVVHDTAIDNLLGSAVMLCRENASASPDGSCPVSGIPYQFDPAIGLVICTLGHLGGGLVISSDGCSLKRDSVAAEVRAFMEAGYGWPVTLEDMYTVSSGESGRRGGYSCPDNGYKYYEIRDGAVFCPFHEEATPISVTE